MMEKWRYVRETKRKITYKRGKSYCTINKTLLSQMCIELAEMLEVIWGNWCESTYDKNDYEDGEAYLERRVFETIKILKAKK